MTIKAKSEFLILCGAINDIHEKLPNSPGKKQLKIVQLKMEAIIEAYIPDNNNNETIY